MTDKIKATEKFVVRGGEPMAAGELPGHLALALRLENIGVLLGAGASVSAGGETIKQLWARLTKDHPDTFTWLKANGYVAADDTDPNIEEVLSLLALSERELKRRAESTVETVAHGKVVTAAVLKAARLDNRLWTDRESIEAQAVLEPFRRLLARFQGSRQPGQAAPWVFTTNYDLSVEWAAEALGIHVVNGFSGLHDRRFQPNAFDLSLLNSRAVGEARFGSYNVNVVKMHGSLSWLVRKDEDLAEVSCSTADAVLKAHIECKESDDGVLLIQPTKAKYFDTVGFVYGELIRRFTEFLARPNTALIVSGYGFNDEHINRLLASGLLNPTLQLIIYYPGWEKADDAIKSTFLQKVRSLALPRVIICGGGDKAYFDAMTKDLPDPAMVDELSPEARRMLSQLTKTLSAGSEKP